MENITPNNRDLFGGQPIDTAAANLANNVRASREKAGTADSYDSAQARIINGFSLKARTLQIESEALRERLQNLVKQWLEIKTTDGTKLDASVDQYVRDLAQLDGILKQLEKQRVALRPRETDKQNYFGHIDPRSKNKWGELLAIIRSKNGLQATDKFYSLKDLIDKIQRVKNRTALPNILTSAGGLYETVILFLQADKTPALPEADKSASEFTAKTKADLDAFKDFVKSHQTTLNRSGEYPEDFIYNNFYTTDNANPKFDEGDATFENLKQEYNKKAKKVLDYFLSLSQKYAGKENPSIAPDQKSIDDGWVYFGVNGGAKKAAGAKLGRLYLNIDPEKVADFYQEALAEFLKSQSHIDAKFSKEASTHDFNRNDKMVIYFNEDEQQKVLGVIQELYAKHKNEAYFLPEVPRFTAEVCDDLGLVMQGVGFGEEPDQPDHKNPVSFGGIRSDILAEVYKRAQRMGYALSDPRIEDTFRKVCTKRGVDPNNAAFNADGKHFQLMRKRNSSATHARLKKAA